MNRGARKEVAFLTALASAGLLLAGKRPLGAAVGISALALHLWPSFYSFRNQAVIITGGSRGLGLALAERLLLAGARVALIAREAEELDDALTILHERASGEAFAIPCDITDPAELKRAFEQAEGIFGRIDILINNAGAIAIGPLDTMQREDFDALLNLQVHAVVEATRQMSAHFRANGGGRIVNICSLGGKVAVPHMSTYCAAKFALAGLSSAMASELAVDDIVVTTVFPGLMRTGSPIQVAIKGDHEKEFAWFAAGDVAPFLSISADQAARRILEGVRNGDAQVLFPTTAKLAVFAQSNFPELFALVMRQSARFFPKGTSVERKTGAESKSWLERQSWYGVLKPTSDEAEEDYNQKDKSDAEFNLGL